MAGHSQFKNIMHRKGKQDAKRAKLFTRLGREITIAAKQGLPDVAANPRLRLAVQNAKAENMPKDNIDRAINKALGTSTESYDEVRYEGYGPKGIAIIIEAMTDNRNRTGGSIRSTFTKFGGSLGETGSVAHSFAHVCEIRYLANCCSKDKFFEESIEAGAIEAEITDDTYIAICPVAGFSEVTSYLEDRLGPLQSVEILWRPQVFVAIDEQSAPTVLKLIAALEDNDDVQNVYSNFDIAEDIMEKIAGL